MVEQKSSILSLPSGASDPKSIFSFAFSHSFLSKDFPTMTTDAKVSY